MAYNRIETEGHPFSFMADAYRAALEENDGNIQLPEDKVLEQWLNARDVSLRLVAKRGAIRQ